MDYPAIKFRYDQHGVPILRSVQVEELAAIFLRTFHPECFGKPQLTPLARIMDRLQAKSGVRFVFDKQLGHLNGKKILGQIHLHKRLVFVDPSITTNGPLFNFTVAHEIGHFALHRKRRLTIPGMKDDTIDDDSKSVFPLNRVPQSPRDRLESQANRFAAALLMPAKTVYQLVAETQEKLGLSVGHRGRIYLDGQPRNQADFRAIINQFKLCYETSFTAIRIRLLELGILQEVPDEKRVAEIISSMGFG